MGSFTARDGGSNLSPSGGGETRGLGLGGGAEALPGPAVPVEGAAGGADGLRGARGCGPGALLREAVSSCGPSAPAAWPGRRPQGQGERRAAAEAAAAEGLCAYRRAGTRRGGPGRAQGQQRSLKPPPASAERPS